MEDILKLQSLISKLNGLINMNSDDSIWVSESNSVMSFKRSKKYTEQEIESFELKNKIILPKDYKRFLMDVGVGEYYVNEQGEGFTFIALEDMVDVDFEIFKDDSKFPQNLPVVKTPYNIYEGYNFDYGKDASFTYITPTELDQIMTCSFLEWFEKLIDSGGKEDYLYNEEIFTQLGLDAKPTARLSTQNLDTLLDINELKKLCQSIAVAEDIISNKPEFKYYNFNSNWDKDVSVFSMDNGSGDFFFIIFSKDGVLIKGFAHEYFMSPHNDNKDNKYKGKVWPGVLDEIPVELSTLLDDPAFDKENTTFCIWRLKEDEYWKIGDIDFPSRRSYMGQTYDGYDPDGSIFLLELLDGDIEKFVKWIKEYYEKDVSIDVIQKIFNHEEITEDMVNKLNPKKSLKDIKDVFKESGYNS
jgi:hypothetical protein